MTRFDRVLIGLAALGMIACLGGGTARAVVVPTDTNEGKKCLRECRIAKSSCQGTCGRNEVAGTCTNRCEKDYNDCKITCPDACWSDDQKCNAKVDAKIAKRKAKAKAAGEDE